MRPARPAILAVLLAALAGCGAEAPAGGTTTSGAASSAGSCTTVVRDGATVTDDLIDKGCTDENGSKRVGKVTTCKSGQRLWEMNGLIGLSGKPMMPENEKDPDGLTVRVLNETACKL